MPFYKISKLEAARRQLQTAIKLFFNDGDSISIHTLAAAAYTILRDLADDQKMIIEDEVLSLVKDEMRSTFIKKMKEPQNFFKHADKDPKNELRFNPKFNDIRLFYAVWLYNQFSDDLSFWIQSYKVWFIVNNSDLFIGLGEPYLSQAAKMSKENFSKSDFIKLMKEINSKYIN